MLNIKKLILYGLSVFMTGLISLNTSQAASVPNSSFINDNQSYQTAFIYFLPDYKDGELEGDNDHNREYCRKQGYTHNYKNCASPRILKDRCPVGNYYKQCYCAGSPSCTGSKSSSNPYPTSTGASMTSCVDCPGNTLYTWTCSSSTCASYQISGSCPSRGYCSRCCDGYYKLDSCQSGYHIEGSGSSATCVLTCVPAANETGCSYGTETCSDGCGGTRTCCKGCTPASDETGCSYGTYSCSDGCGGTRKCCSAAPSCTPASDETGCSYGTYSCSDGCGGTRKCCSAAPACTPLSSETSCSTGYGLNTACDDGCGGTRSCCIACDPEDRNCQCPGKVYCDPDTKVGDGATCTAGSKTFYERCLVKETCDSSNYDGSDGYCITSTGSAWSEMYYVEDKCTTQKGTTYKYYSSCTGYSAYNYKDCAGKTAPAKGLTMCNTGTPGGKQVTCGGHLYAETCSGECASGLYDGLCYSIDSSDLDYWTNSAGYYKVKDFCTAGGKSYVYVISCNYSSLDCNGKTPKCQGYKECPAGSEGSGGSCSCGGVTFYKECSECNTYGTTIDGDFYGAQKESDSWSGYEKLDYKCDLTDGTKVYYYVGCTDDKAKAPCKGYKSCGSGYFGAGSTCSCGGKTYYEACATECNYEKTAADCTSGQTFVQKCYGTKNGEQTWYGECK